MTVYQALVCSEPGQLKVEKRSINGVVAPGYALVHPRRVGICGTDYHIFEGKHPFLQYPRVMGHELAAEIVEAPDGFDLPVGEICVVNPYIACGTCNACRVGKPNCCSKVSVLGVHEDGGMAGVLALPARNLVRASGLSVDECATVEFLAIGAHAVSRSAISDVDRVLVVGLGPIGLGVALFARLATSRVFVYDLDRERVATAQSIAGVEALSPDVDLYKSVADFTDGEGFDVVFDATGNRHAMEKGFDCVGHGGRYVLVSVVKDPITFQDADFHRKEMTMLGSRNATALDFDRVISAIRSKDIPANDLITHRTNLDNAVRDLPKWAAAKQNLVKAIIEIND